MRDESSSRKRPEDWLAKAEASERTRGRLKIFLGYAPGVGKTFSMLSEGIRRKSRGEDVVIGVVETHGRAGTMEVAAKLDRVPMREIDYKGTLFQEMDLEAILARAPEVALIDELAHTNIEGSRHAKRYEDVFALLEAKIDVVTTLNVQHVESLTPRVQSLTGITVRETVPDWVLDRADEIVMSDLTPEALAMRMRRGDIYPMERVERALANFFRRGNLIALREMALQRVTRSVDKTLDDYVKLKQLGAHWTVAERIAVCVSASPRARDLIARGARLAQGMDAELFVIHLDSDEAMAENATRTLEDNLEFAVNLGARVVHLKGTNVATATAQFAKEQRITQAIFGSPELTGFKKYLYLWEIARFVRAVPHVDLHIVTQGDTLSERVRILIVDDERQILRVLRSSLESHGYEVAMAADGAEGLRAYEQFSPALVISDLMMPKMDGVELTRAIRKLGETPIIVLSVREQDAAKVNALDSGADDYMTKPFSTPELLARVRVQLRRRQERREEAETGTVTEGDFSIDREAHKVKVRGEEVHLTPKEFDLLLLFARNAGRVMTHKTLLTSVWGAAGAHQPEYLRVLVAQLRKKIDLPVGSSYIENEPWVGYRFRAEAG